MSELEESFESNPKAAKGGEARKRLLAKPFDLQQQIDDPHLSDLPFSEDIHFEYVNLDLERLGKLKKTNFWIYLLENLKPHARFGEILSIDQLVSFYPKYEEPLFALKSKHHFFIEKTYGWILKLIGESERPSKNPEWKMKKLINFALENEDCVRDELYLMLIKLLRNNPKADQTEKVWNIFSIACGTFLPSKVFLPAVYNYLVSVTDNFPEERIKEWANYSLKRYFN